MDLILLISVMSSSALLLLVVAEDESFNNLPCQTSNKKTAYKQFEANHTIPDNFKTSSKSAWESHIKRLGRCNVKRQTFIKKSQEKLVEGICNGNGWNQEGNLCTSNSAIPVYDVKVKTCRVLSIPKEKRRSLTVACDKVGRRCVPVHVEGRKQKKKRERETCGRPRLDRWSNEKFNTSVMVS